LGVYKPVIELKYDLFYISWISKNLGIPKVENIKPAHSTKTFLGDFSYFSLPPKFILIMRIYYFRRIIAWNRI